MKFTSIALLTAALAFTAGAGSALANDQSSTHENTRNEASPHATDSAHDNSFQVNEQFSRTVGDNCQYSGALRGHVDVVHRTGFMATNRYSPDLRLSGEVRCPAGQTQRVTTRSIRGTEMSQAELQRAVESEGRIDVTQRGRVCTVSPSIAWRNDRIIVGPTFAQSCRNVAQGGGPVRRE